MDRERSTWPRQIYLQALALATDHLQRETTAPFSLPALLAHLTSLPSFGAQAERWLTTALTERIILPQPGTVAKDAGLLNRRHPLVQKALLIRERILSTTSILQAERGWIAFATLEQALKTCRDCAGSQRLRQLWLELLVELDVLHIGQQPQPDGPSQTTTLALNPESPVIAIPRQQQQRNVIRLIVVCSNYQERRQLPWAIASHVLRRLTGLVTHTEARDALRRAEQEGIVAVEVVPGRRNPGRPVTVIKLHQEHERVHEWQALRDHLIRLTSQALGQRPLGISEAVLIETFWSSYQLTEDEGWFWLRLLEQDDILSVAMLQLGSQGKEKIVDLRLGDPVVRQAQQHVRR